MELPGKVTERSAVIYMTGALCTQPAQFLRSWQARGVIQTFLGQLRTRLGIQGWEQEGPRQAAEALFRHLAGPGSP